MKGGLTRRMVLWSCLLALLVGGAFVFLLLAITNFREATDLRRLAREAQVAANALETLVIDLETGLRGFVITGKERFLEPWHDARTAFPKQAAALERLLAEDPDQLSRVRGVVKAGRSYIDDYAVPLVDAVRRNDPTASSVGRTQEGKTRVDAMRSEFAAFAAAERAVLTAREVDAVNAADRALVAAGVGVVGSILLIVLFFGYLTRKVVSPVRRASLMAGRLAGGDLATRMPESSTGEIGDLERSFNIMASSLERSRAELAASRVRIVAASDQTRRRLERNLHDGTQQRLVTLGLELRAAEMTVPPELAEVKQQMSQVAEGLDGALEDLREISRGIHPAILSEGGLVPAIKALARRSPVPAELDLRSEGRLPAGIEVAAYYVVSEALANAAKHANASVVHIDLDAGDDDVLRLIVRDDGVGGVDLGRGSGLIGLTDRVEALGGTIAITSPIGEGTSLVIALPLGKA